MILASMGITTHINVSPLNDIMLKLSNIYALGV
jgi:hypothetical protein